MFKKVVFLAIICTLAFGDEIMVNISTIKTGAYQKLSDDMFGEMRSYEPFAKS